MSTMRSIRLGLLATVAIAAVSGLPAAAQQITGTPGSPGATTTIDGKYLPPPPPKFGGDINLQASQSKPYWPARVVPPKGAPNVLLIMTDDQGYGVSGTFGGVIPTPAMDRIAQMGLRYTQFHSTALCSPTRAAFTGVLKVDGKEVATRKIPHTTPFIIAVEETFDVGVDTRTDDEDKNYEVRFRF